ncbi:MAG: ZIP family metal transporter [Comamonadaceae bacterium]|nr:MAG: ZIP family metal transporter [Comamonadaceae bacterium]
MDLAVILAATLVAGVGSVWVAGMLLRLGVRGDDDDAHGPQHLLSLAAGALLATAFMHLLPEAFHSSLDPALLFGVLLFGLVLFFLLDKAELWHHGHEHGDGVPAAAPGAGAHDHGHGHAGHHNGHAHVRRGGGWTLLTGDSVHCFGDGVLIASAFVADWRLGMLAALAVLAHEVPHHVGDLVVLRRTSPDARVALIKVSLAGTVTALGGLVGWWLVDKLPSWLPYLLVLASSSFVYVALADLIPQLQRRLSARQTVSQVAWLVAGILLVTLVSRLAHSVAGHSHDHDHDHGHAHEQGHSQGAHEPAHEGGHRHEETVTPQALPAPAVAPAASGAATVADPAPAPAPAASATSAEGAATSPPASTGKAHAHDHGKAGHRH